MDLNRLYRARIAQRMERVEARRKLFTAGKLAADKIDADEWGMIVAMDEIEAKG